jgi:ketosteroid isomerase-like protein
MTTATATIAELDAELNTTILEGRIMDAFERFYADDVVMQENAEAPTVGKAANRDRELGFIAAVETFHGVTLLASATEGDVSLGEWVLDVTFKGAERRPMHQASVRRWRNGEVASERFYYNKG